MSSEQAKSINSDVGNWLQNDAFGGHFQSIYSQKQSFCNCCQCQILIQLRQK